MTTPINSRDLALQAVVPRVLQVSTNYLVLTAPSLQFKYGSDNVPQPTQIIVTASLLGRLEGTVTFTSTGLSPAPVQISPTELRVLPGSFTGDFITINASVAWQGSTYQAVPISISKVYNQLVAKVQRPIDLVPSYNDGTGYTLPTEANYLELYNGVNKVTETLVYGPSTQTKNGLTLTVNSSTGQIALSQAAPNAWTGSVENFTVTVLKSLITYTATYNITKAKAGAGGIQANEIYVYKWSVGQPALPTGTSLYTWTTNTHSYSSTDWATTVPTNPGTVGIGLWKATKLLITEASLVNTQISTTWATGSSVKLVTTEANELIKTYTAKVYKNDVSIPGILGTSTLTWSSRAFTAPSTWSLTAPAEAPGQVLYIAEVLIQAAQSQTTSTIDWTQSSITPLSYYGTDGSSARRAYVVVTTTPATTPAVYVSTGDALPVTGTWFVNKTWTSTAPSTALLEGETVYQSDGVYIADGNTTWGFPYISTLKVGNLQAISANTGTLTVTGSIKGGLATSLTAGNGYYLASDGKFRVGKSLGARLEWDGNGLVVYSPTNTAILSAGRFEWSAVTGTTKPADNATVGAPSGTYVDTVLAEDLVTAVDTAQTTADTKLSKAGASILSGTISMEATAGAGFVAGNLAWSASGVRTSGSGVAMTPGGLVGHNGTKTTFKIGTDGNATFGGTVEAALLKSTDGNFVIDLANKTISITV